VSNKYLGVNVHTSGSELIRSVIICMYILIGTTHTYM